MVRSMIELHSLFADNCWLPGECHSGHSRHSFNIVSVTFAVKCNRRLSQV